MSGWAGTSKRLPWPSPVNTCDRREADHYSLYMFQVGSQQGGDLPNLPALPVSCVTIKWAHHIRYTLKSHTSRLHSRRNSLRALWIAIADLYDHTTAMFSQDNVNRRLKLQGSFTFALTFIHDLEQIKLMFRCMSCPVRLVVPLFLSVLRGWKGTKWQHYKIPLSAERKWQDKSSHVPRHIE